MIKDTSRVMLLDFQETLQIKTLINLVAQLTTIQDCQPQTMLGFWTRTGFRDLHQALVSNEDTSIQTLIRIRTKSNLQ